MNSSPRALKYLTQGLRVAAAFLTAVVLPVTAGPLLQLTYVGLPQGTTVSTLTNAPTFPNAPSFGAPLIEGLKS
ncbi:MAG TPA: hypothetical protein VN673_17970, partial [Clostridia bacterium]|nr:hypothetical protein [Clostridia bacterium]